MGEINPCAKNFEIEDGSIGDACTFEMAVSGFKVDNVRSYPRRGLCVLSC